MGGTVCIVREPIGTLPAGYAGTGKNDRTASSLAHEVELLADGRSQVDPGARREEVEVDHGVSDFMGECPLALD